MEHQEPKPQMSQIPPNPPIKIGLEFFEDQPNSNKKQKQLLSPENIQELPPHISLYTEIPLDIIEIYNTQFMKQDTINFCINCAKLKQGPWSKCPRCGFQPKMLKDLAAQFALTALPKEYENYVLSKRLEVANYVEENPKLIQVLSNLIFKKSQDIMIELKRNSSKNKEPH